MHNPAAAAATAANSSSNSPGGGQHRVMHFRLDVWLGKVLDVSNANYPAPPFVSSLLTRGSHVNLG
jgi:hypothetical protein